MSEPDLLPRTGLESIAVPGRYGARTDVPGVAIVPRQDLALAIIMARAGKVAELAARAAETLGVELPMTPRRIAGGTISFAWAGPGQWLAASENAAPHVFEQNLRREFAGLASVVNQSDGRTVLRVGGPKVREALAKGIPIDLDPVSFAPGDTALTVAGHINLQFWQLDETPTYEFTVFRSFAGAFCEWLKEAAGEFGVTIASDTAR